MKTSKDLIKEHVCEDCGCAKFYPKLGGIICNECKTFYSYERLRNLYEKKILKS